MYETLRDLSSALGVTGHEKEARDAIMRSGRFSDCHVDNLGNLLCFGDHKDGAPTLLLDTHMDEVGFMVRYIDDDGMIYVEPLGHLDPRCMIGNRLIIRGREDIEGIVSNIPPHLSKENKVPKISEIPIDTGLSKSELEGLVEIGSPVGFCGPLIRLGKNKVSGKALDNRVGCLVACEVSKRVCSDGCNIIYLFSSQEEVGTRGAISALKRHLPDMSICIDATQGDMHFIRSPITRELGSGTIIGTGPNVDRKIFDRLVSLSRREGIPFTTKAYANPSPTNLRSIQLAGPGVPSGLLGIPLRYMHTPTEIVDLRDVEATIRLMMSFIDDIDDIIEGGFSCY
ncbi:MAG: hypothetical protein JW825_01205 [Candidatus Methanofastidiosa archaeon]|nr:hypothetical protein [Candidatus Methanofastidiosa archaeon]